MAQNRPEVTVPLVAQILIAGPIQCGKTYLSAQLEEFLRGLGYEVNVIESNAGRKKQAYWQVVRELFRKQPSIARERGLSVQITVCNWL